jgi:uncharacterized protein (TIGR02145 family)
MKRILLTIVLLTQLVFIGCEKEKAKEPESTTVTIGTQIWTKSNYTINGKELFTDNEAKAVTPPEGFRLPTKNDWGKLLTFVGDKGVYYTSTAYWSATNVITATSREGDFEIIKSLLAPVKWNTLTGTNTTGFNAKPISGDFWVIFYVSDPVYGYTEFNSNGYYLVVFSKDIRLYSTPPNSYPDKYAIRFVKDK